MFMGLANMYCIPIAAVHNITGFVRVRVTLQYEQFLSTFLTR